MLDAGNGRLHEVEKMPGNAVSRAAAGLCLATRTPMPTGVRQCGVGG